MTANAAVVAAIGSRRFPEQVACRHCSAPVRRTGYAYGQEFEHFDPDASYRDSVWTHCRLTVAAPHARALS